MESEQPPLILITDDDESARKLLFYTLRDIGYDFIECANGAEAVAACRQRMPDLVLMDILMPGMDGITACEQIRGLPGGQEIPLLMFTALNDATHIERALKAGATEYITKPATPIVLRHRVHRLVRAKQAEDELRASEQKYRSVFEAIKDALLIIDVNTAVILDANPAASAVYGYPRAELIGRSLTELSAEPANTWQTLRERQVYVPLRFHRRQDGISFPVEITYSYYTQGDRQLVTEAVRDITARKQAEDALRESELRYRQMFEQNQAVKLLIDPATRRIIQANPAAARFYGYPIETLQHLRITDINQLPPDQIAAEMQVTNDQRRDAFISPHRLASGEIRQVEVHSSPLDLGGQRVLYSIIHDITERQQMEAALRWNESLLQMMAASSPLAFFVVDNRTDEILYFNQRFCQIWGIAHLAEQMRRGELKCDDVLHACLPVLVDATAFVESCRPLQDEANRLIVEDHLACNDGRTIRRYSTQIRGPHDEYYGRFYIFEDITDVKQSQAEIARLARQNELILTSAGEGICGLDASGCITFVNPTVEHLTGYAAAELIGRSQHELLHHSHADGSPYPPAACPIYAAFRDGVVHQATDEVFWRKDGTCFPVEYISTPLREGDCLTGAVVVFNDITRRRENEALSRKLMRAVEQSPVSIVITDRYGDIEYVNPKFSQASGYTPAEVLGQNPRILKSGLTPLETYQELWAAITTGHEWHGELCNKKKNGKLYWEFVSISPIVDTDGRVANFLGVKEDITARKQVEEELARLYQAEQTQRQWAEALRDTAAQLTETLNLDEVLDRVLDNVGRVVPHEGAHIILLDGDQIHLVRARGQIGQVTPPTAPLSLADAPILRQLAETHQPLLIQDSRIFTAWGAMPHAPAFSAVLGVPIRFQQRVLGFLTVTSETPNYFTASQVERLQAFTDQAAIAIENARLYLAERQQFDRWQQSQAILAQSEKMAALGRLAAALAHEINNPLQAIQSHLELVMDFPLEADEQRQFLQIMRQEITRLSQLTRNVLNFARPTPEPHHPASLDDLIQHTLALAGKQLQHQHIEVTTDLQPTPPVLVSAEQMTQVFLNILLNAIEAMRQDGHIRISTRLEAAGVTLSIANDGPAIPLKDLPHIFEPFYTTKADGTGLGLSTSHGLIQQHGGTLSVENVTETRGVVFRITLPLIPTNEPCA